MPGANIGNLTGGAGIDAPFVGAPLMPSGVTSRPIAASAYRAISRGGALNYLGKDWSFIPGAPEVPDALNGQVAQYAIASLVLRAPSDMPFLASGATTLSFQGWDGTQWVSLWTGTSVGTRGETINVSGLANTLYYGHQVVISGDGSSAAGIAFVEMWAAREGILSAPPAQRPSPPVEHAPFMPLTSGSYGWTGNPLVLNRQTTKALTLTRATYGVTGGLISLRYTSVQPAKSLALGTAAPYAISGRPVNLRYIRNASPSLAPASYAVSVQPINLKVMRSWRMALVPGSYAISGQPVAMAVVRTRVLALVPASYTASGQAPALVGLLSETAAWVTAVVAAGGSVSTSRQMLVNDLIRGLKFDGVWSKLDRLWLFAAENSTSALRDLVARDVAITANSPTFTIDRGYAGDGSTSYVDTGYTPSTDAINFAVNSAHIAIWDTTSRAAATAAAVGVNDLSVLNDLLPYGTIFSTTGLIFHFHDGSTTTTLANTASQGFFISEQTASNATQGFYNGTSLGIGGAVTNILPSASFWVGGRHDPTAKLTQATTDQFAMVGFGAALTTAQAAAYYARLRTYMTAVGVP